MEDIIEEFNEISGKCKTLADRFSEKTIAAIIERFEQVIKEAEVSWSGSWIGYHATTYLERFAPRTAADFFDVEWGLMERGFGGMGRSRGRWVVYEENDVRKLIIESGGGDSADSTLTDLARDSREGFLDAKNAMLALLDALLSRFKDAPLKEIRVELNKLQPSISAQDFIDAQRPRRVVSRDSTAMMKGITAPPHKVVEAFLMQTKSHQHSLNELVRLASRAAKYTEKKNSLSVEGVVNKLKRAFTKDKPEKDPRRVKAGRDVLIANSGGILQRGHHSQIAGRDAMHFETPPLLLLRDDELVDEAKFREDVTEILHLLTGAKEQIEGDVTTLVQLFASFLGISVKDKTVAEVRDEIASKVSSSPAAKSTLEGIRSNAVALAQGIVSNAIFSQYIQPLLIATT